MKNVRDIQGKQWTSGSLKLFPLNTTRWHYIIFFLVMAKLFN